MTVPKKNELTNDPEVRQEIERYRWIRFEMNGVTIGIVKATKEWLAHCSREWRKVHVVTKKFVRKNGVIGRTRLSGHSKNEKPTSH